MRVYVCFMSIATSIVAFVICHNETRYSAPIQDTDLQDLRGAYDVILLIDKLNR